MRTKPAVCGVPVPAGKRSQGVCPARANIYSVGRSMIMMKEVLIRHAQKVAAAASVALLVGSLVVVPAHAKSTQKIGEFDSTVTLENSGAGSVTVMGGTANTNIGVASAKNGATQEIGKFKANVSLKNAGIGAVTVFKGTANTNVGSAVVD